jgi:LysR family glycine cleavage system transcriptional activator
MQTRLPPLNALRVFEAAARHLSFKHASDELAVTPAAISHQIKQLEDFLGVELFHRLTRALKLTPQGETLLPKVREGLACFSAGVERVRTHEADEPLIVVMPPTFASAWLMPRLKDFTRAEPGITLHLVSSLAMVDSDSGPKSPYGEFAQSPEDDQQIFVRYGTGTYPGCQIDRIFSPDYVAVCSPALLQGEHPLRTPDDIRFHTRLQDDTLSGDPLRPAWGEWLAIAGVAGVDAKAGPHFSDSVLALTAALNGLGVALASPRMVSREIEGGRLVSPFSIKVSYHYTYHLVIPETMVPRPAVQAFRQWLLKAAG